MKKKALFIAPLILCAMLLLSFIGPFSYRMPFRHLTETTISGVSVTLSPPDKTFTLSQQEISQLVKILNTVVTYHKDQSYTEYCGQAVIFQIDKADGTQQRVMAYTPFLVVDGVGYRTKYQPCNRLSSFGNQILYERTEAIGAS